MKLNIHGSEEAKRLAELLEKEGLDYRRGLKKIMWRAITALQAEMMANVQKNFRVGSGMLLNSIPQGSRVSEENGVIKGEVGPEGVPYASIHEFGGEITPKNAKYLAIPLDEVKGPDGIARAKPMDFAGRSFFIKSRAGNLILAMRAEGGEMVPLFLMKKSVKVPARPYIRPALEAKREEIAEKFGLFLDETFGLE